MRCHSVHALLLVLMAAIMAVTPSVAIRGTNKMMTRRSLQEVGGTTGASSESKESKDAKDDKVGKEDKGDKESKEDKAEKEDKMDKKADPKKGGKKDKKACKKAADKNKKSKKDGRRVRALEKDDKEDKEDVFEGDIDDLGYCSQGEWSDAQCTNLAGVRSDGKIESNIKIGLVHNDEKHPLRITEEAEEILDNGEIQSRFVGCKDMDSPPPPPKKSSKKKGGDDETRRHRARRNLSVRMNRKLPSDEHEVIFRTAEEEIDVTGVDFRNLQIIRGGCDDKNLPEGAVCDVIQSNVDIFYQSAAGQDPTEDDREDMHNLLIETIVRQANAGAFGDIGSVESVNIEESSAFGSRFGGGFGNSNSSSSGGGGINFIPIIGGVLAALVVAGSVYWFCFRGGADDEDENAKGQNDDTSDEEHYTSSDEEEEKRQKQGTVASVPVAQVLAVEDPAAAKIDEDKKEKQGWW